MVLPRIFLAHQLHINSVPPFRWDRPLSVSPQHRVSVSPAMIFLRSDLDESPPKDTSRPWRIQNRLQLVDGQPHRGMVIVILLEQLLDIALPPPRSLSFLLAFTRPSGGKVEFRRSRSPCVVGPPPSRSSTISTVTGRPPKASYPDPGTTDMRSIEEGPGRGHSRPARIPAGSLGANTPLRHLTLRSPGC